MKSSLFLILSLAVALIAHSQEPQPLLTPQQMPNPVRFLPPPHGWTRHGWPLQ